MSTTDTTGSVDVVTFGCRLNLVESEAMRTTAVSVGLRNAVIVNTCAVTAESVRQARQTIRRMAREKPDTRIIVSGCASETARVTFAAMPEVSDVIGNARKTESDVWHGLLRGEKDASDIMAQRYATRSEAMRIAGHTRGFLAIQNGCDHRCTFCIIPYGRGPSRSLPADQVIEQACRLVDSGHQEIVLTGVDLTSWGGDLEGRPVLGQLVRSLLKAVPQLRRLRLSSLDCIEADDALMRALAEEERLAPHLHLSLQAGDDLILKRMKRRHSRADALRFCADVRRLRPDIVLGADLIAGFPTENDAMFENTVCLIEDCGLTHLHVFPYSAREQTPAAKMPQVVPAIARARASRLRALGSQALSGHLQSQTGRKLTVLCENGGTGRAHDFSPVATPDSRAGDFITMTITGVNNRNQLVGQAE